MLMRSCKTKSVMQPRDLPGHNASLAILGVFILWFGWYGFNPGSSLAILGVSSVSALAAVNTTLSGAAGTLSTMLILAGKEYLATGTMVWDLIGSANGTLAGLVGITAACAFVEVRCSGDFAPI
jgi:ammonium transporter, Amt family